VITQPPLVRRLVAESLGTGLLIVSVIGSGKMATNLTDDAAIQLLANAGATVGALIALIMMFGPISGAHFNPVVTIADCVLNRRAWRDLPPYLFAQTIGGCLGAAVANLMFSIDVFGPSTKVREGGGVWLGEVVATLGLLSVIFLIGKHRAESVPLAVGVWIGGAYWFTSSTSLANPAVTVARSLSDSFAGIAPASVPMFVVMQLVGLIAALPLLAFLRRE
jgi:arsenate reductase